MHLYQQLELPLFKDITDFNKIAVVFLCCFNLHFPEDSYLCRSSYACLPCVYLLWWGIWSKFCPLKFFVVLLSFESFLYIFDFSPLSELSFTNIFLSLWFVFSFTWPCLSQSRSFNFNEAQLIMFFFLFFPWIVPLMSYVRSHCQGFPGGLVVRTLYFHCTGYGFDPWLGN